MADGSAHIPKARPTGGRRRAPDEVWGRVRDDYLAGMTAVDACRRHGVTVCAMRDRAAREGWRRLDQPWAPPPNAVDGWDEGVALEDRVEGDLDRIHLRQLSYVAHRRMMRAVLRGEALQALRWRRVRQVMDAEDAEIDRMAAQHELIRRHRREQAELTAQQAGEARNPGAAQATPDATQTDSTDSTDSIFKVGS